MAWTKQEDAYIRRCTAQGITMVEAAEKLGKDYSTVKARRRLLCETRERHNPQVKADITSSSDRELILENVNWLLDLGYRSDVASLVRHRLDRLARSVDEAWWRSRVERWTLAEWVERLATAGAGTL